jgi:hypothetical protein
MFKIILAIALFVISFLIVLLIAMEDKKNHKK